MKLETKKGDSTASPKTLIPKQNDGLIKGNGTKPSPKPQSGKNPNGKDGAQPDPQETN